MEAYVHGPVYLMADKTNPKTPMVVDPDGRQLGTVNLQKPEKKTTGKSSALQSGKIHKDTATVKEATGKKPTAPKGVASTQAVAPSNDGRHQLDTVTSGVLQRCLDQLMDKAMQELPEPDSDADLLAMNRFKTSAGESLKNALSLNVTKRVLNIHNPFVIKLQFSSTPSPRALDRMCVHLGLPSGSLRQPVAPNTYIARLKTIADMDRVFKKPVMNCGKLSVTISTSYQFLYCPDKINTVYQQKAINNVDKEKSETKKDNVDVANIPVTKPIKESGTKTNTATTEDSLDETPTMRIMNITINGRPTKANESKCDPSCEQKKDDNTPQAKEAQKPQSATIESNAKVATNVKAAQNTKPIESNAKVATNVKAAQNKKIIESNAKINTNMKAVQNENLIESNAKAATNVKAVQNEKTIESNAKINTNVKAVQNKKLIESNAKDSTNVKPVQKSKAAPVTPKMPGQAPSLKKAAVKQTKEENDYDELDDNEILALLSKGIVIDECGTDED